MTQLPVPPDGVRPGHLGVIAVGRVILGDIAATAVDLALRGMLRIESADGGAGGWSLTLLEPPGKDREDTLEYERVLLEWVARPRRGAAASLASLAADLPAGRRRCETAWCVTRCAAAGCGACTATSGPGRARNCLVNCGNSGGNCARPGLSARKSWRAGCCRTRCTLAWPGPTTR